MALAATTIWEVETGGSDTLNGGAFDPGQTAGMLSDGAATVANTSAPVFTSASYNFVAGDVGAWIYIPSGTNWTPGFYKIASVAANAATLDAAIGHAVLLTALGLSTVVGCATVASPTAGKWTIDYSQQAAAQFAYTDLASAGTGLTVSSTLKPFGKQQVGNSIVITGGTNFNAGRYVIASVSVGLVATVVGPTNITTGAGASGTGGQGGAVASPGLVAGLKVAQNIVFPKTGTYSITSASTNVAGGCIADSTDGIWEGYQTYRFDLGTAPILQASGISTFVIFTTSSTGQSIRNLTADGATLTSSRGFVLPNATAYQLTAKNCTNRGFQTGTYVRCAVTGCTTVTPAMIAAHAVECVAYSNTVSGMGGTGGTLAFFERCLSYSNSGATSDGFLGNVTDCYVDCVAYGNGRNGFTFGSRTPIALRCIAESNTGYGFGGAANTAPPLLQTCAAYSNTGGNVQSTAGQVPPYFSNLGFITGTGSFFTNAASGDFSLNNTAGAGAAVRGLTIVLPVGLTTSYPDAGVAQHADPTAIKYPIFQSPIVEAMEVSA